MSETETTRAVARRTWIELEAPEVIELKRIVLDKDRASAAAFFREVVVPKTRAAAERRGMAVPQAERVNDGLVPG